MKKGFIIFLGIIWCSYSIKSIASGIYFKKDTINTDSVQVNTSSILFGTDYSSNTNTFGKFSDFAKQPSFSPYISFSHKSGLLLTGLVNIVANSDSSSSHSTYQFNLKGGYQFKLFKDVTLTPSYSHYFFDENTLTINTLYNNYAEANLSVSKTYWYGSVSAGYLWGRLEEFSIDARVGASYSWDGLLFRNDALLITGSLVSFFNNPNYLGKLFYFLGDYAEQNPTATRADLIYDLYWYNNNPYFYSKTMRAIRQKLRDNKTLRWMARDYIPADVTIADFLNYNNQFAITSLSASVSIAYLIGDVTVNFDYSLYRMLNQPVYATEKYHSYITAGICYSLEW